MFTDQVRLLLQAGKGGNGIVAWRREKYIPKGGPYGGNGGPGGSIRIIADPQVPNLDHFRNDRILRAEDGGIGGSNCRQGRCGKDLKVYVPLGTLVKDAQDGSILMDCTEPGQELLLCQGGKGGLGNAFFRTPTQQAPKKWTPGKLGAVRSVDLELKLIADVGFVGFPNAGKSTLLTQLARVRVKTAPYPFTTLYPNLGCYKTTDHHKIVFADIPGIIRGAHQNRGLGLAFLKHIERTKVLVYVVDASGFEGRDPLDDLQTLRDELTAYDPALLDKPSLIVWNKKDLGSSFTSIPGETVALSALEGDGISLFLEEIEKKISTM